MWIYAKNWERQVIKVNEVLDKISVLIDTYKDDLLDDLKKLVAIESIEGKPLPGKPFGEAVAQALDESLDIARKMGFDSKNHEGYIGVVDWGQGAEKVGVLAHVDIVPPGDMSQWLSSPYELTFDSGYVRGRGVVDDKGPLLSVLYGMKALKSMGLMPNKCIRVIIGTNEETGWGGINYYKERFQEPDVSFSPDGMFTVVNREKGIITAEYKMPVEWKGIKISGGDASNLVPAKAEAILHFTPEQIKDAIGSCKPDEGLSFTLSEEKEGIKLIAKGESAHAMTPEKGTNAISGILTVIRAIEGLDNEIKAKLDDIYELIGTDSNGEALGIAAHDEQSGALTFNLGVIEFKENQLHIKLDIRTPVTSDIDQIAQKVDEKLSEIDFENIHSKIKHPLYVPEECELIKTLCGVYTQVTGDEPAIFSIGGGTYARAFNNCVCFGSVYPKEKLTVHAPNEQTLEENIIKNAKMYALALYELAIR